MDLAYDCTPSNTGPAGESSRTLDIPPHIVSAIQSGDPSAFKHLVTTLYTPLVRFANSIIHSKDRAEDVVQDVFAEVWERRDKWNPRGSVITYLFGTVRHHAIDAVRATTSETRRHERLHDMDESGFSPSPEDKVLEEEQSRAMGAHYRSLQAIVANLPERQHSAYVLRYRQGLTVPQIAVIFGISTKSGEQLLSRVIKTIRERMQGLEGIQKE